MKRQVFLSVYNLIKFYSSEDLSHSPAMVCQKPDKTISWIELFDPKLLFHKVVGGKGKASVRAYVPRNDRLHYLRMIGEDTSIFETNKFEEKKERDKIRLEARLNKDQNNGSSNNGDGDESSGEEDNGDS